MSTRPVTGLAVGFLLLQPTGHSAGDVSQAVRDQIDRGGWKTIAVRKDRRDRREANALKKETVSRESLWEGTKRYTNGSQPSLRDREKFRRIMRRLAHTEYFSILLSHPIESLDGDDFVLLDGFPTSRMITADGELNVSPIRFWMGMNRQLDVQLKAAKLAWRQMAIEILQSGHPTTSRTRQLIDHLQASKKILARLRDMNPNSAVLLTRAAMHCDELLEFSYRCTNEDHIHRLANYLQGYHFAGGSMSELLTYLSKHPIALAPGSNAQQKLFRLASEVIRQDAERHGTAPRYKATETRSPRDDYREYYDSIPSRNTISQR